MRLPTFAELKRFCVVDGWHDRDARRRAKTGDHHRYVKVLHDGTHLYARVSHGSGSVRSPSLFAHILRVELCVTAEQFWLAVDRGVAPVRPGDESGAPAGDALPYDLVDNLQRKVGLSLGEIKSMSKEDGVAAWQEWLTKRGGGSRGED